MSKPRHAANVGVGALILILAAVAFRSDFGTDLSAYTRWLWPLAPLLVLPILTIAVLTLAGFDDDRTVGPHPFQTIRAVLGVIPFLAVLFSAAADVPLSLGAGFYLLFVSTALFAALNIAWPYLPFLTDEGAANWRPPGQQWSPPSPQQVQQPAPNPMPAPNPQPATAGAEQPDHGSFAAAPAAGADAGDGAMAYPHWVALSDTVSASNGTSLEPGNWYWATGRSGSTTDIVLQDGTPVTAELGDKVLDTRAAG